jgi:hypothetical protein
MILTVAVVMSVIAAIASALRGEKFVHEDEESIAQKAHLNRHAHRVRIRPVGEAPPSGQPDGTRELDGAALTREDGTHSPRRRPAVPSARSD